MYRIIGTDGREYGPVSRETLAQWIAERRANAQTSVQPAGAADWQPLGALPEFAEALGTTTKPPLIAPLPPPGPLPARRTNGLAVASLVTGLLSWCCCCGFPFNLLGILFGALALSQINRSPEQERGRELALIGLILSILSLALSLLALPFSLLAAWPDIARGMRHWRF